MNTLTVMNQWLEEDFLLCMAYILSFSKANCYVQCTSQVFLAISLKSLYIHVFLLEMCLPFLFWDPRIMASKKCHHFFVRRDFNLNPSLATIVSLEREKYQSII